MKFEKISDYESVLGKEIEITGKISQIIWQHMIVLQPEYPEISYFSLVDENGEEGHQFVVYSKQPITESGILTLKGKLIKSEGETKHPDKERRKYYYEYQFIVDEILP
ncbi:MAG: hypothetical protein EU530_02220 [Promethearchaeota archaeon]|nr:MAG: hypothetical protein EU530_02220 [Candidatus Lokiarchaeota archaeon]